MQSSMVVAGMDALSESCENILTRRANQRHYSIIACKTPMALPENGLFGAIAGKKSLPTIEVAPVKHVAANPKACCTAHKRTGSRQPSAGKGQKRCSHVRQNNLPHLNLRLTTLWLRWVDE